MSYIKQFFILSFILLFLLNCGGEKKPTFDKSALFWYLQMNQKINHGDLEGAEEKYSSLVSEHISSKLLPSATFILANAHVKKEEYIMARFYYNEYIQKFSTSKDIDYIKYLKIKTQLKSISHIDKSQLLLKNTITQTKNFLVLYPNSKYFPFVKTILTKLMITKNLQNNHIRSLYEQLNNPKAAQIYKTKLSNSYVNSIKYTKPQTPWYKVLFE